MKIIRVVLIVCVCTITVDAVAQKSTEIYTPIGESPGLSHAYTIIGSIESVDESARKITVASDSERWIAEITDETHIWLDRSKARKKNEYGSFSDLKPGSRVELLYVGRERRREGLADWIKVESE